MAAHTLTNGCTITARPADEGATEFETKNADGEVISVVYLHGMDAETLLFLLSVRDRIAALVL